MIKISNGGYLHPARCTHSTSLWNISSPNRLIHSYTPTNKHWSTCMRELTSSFIHKYKGFKNLYKKENYIGHPSQVSVRIPQHVTCLYFLLNIINITSVILFFFLKVTFLHLWTDGENTHQFLYFNYSYMFLGGHIFVVKPAEI